MFIYTHIWYVRYIHTRIHTEDPVVIKEPNVPNSLTKMLMDLFSDSTTASLFYTNDLLVVIDIITRQLTDLNPDDKVTLILYA